ncbi:MAG: hypothetical protein R2783_05675 [Gelidibacter sp.]
MLFRTKSYLIVAFFALLAFASCNDEVLDANVINPQELIAPNSNLANLMQEVSDQDLAECVDFQYPILFTLYNSNFEIIEVVTIQNDEALYNFLEDLINSSNGNVLASLDFPVTLEYANGETVEIENNQQLQAAILDAENHCDTNVENCSLEIVNANLQECHWYAGTNLFNNIIGDQFFFNDGNELVAVNPISNDEIIGTWTIAETGNGLVMTIDMPEPYHILSTQAWSVVECSENRIEMHYGEDYLVFERDCATDDPFGCFGSFDAEIVLCDEGNDGFEIFDLTQAYANCIQLDHQYVSYHLSLADAESNTNALPFATEYTNISNPETIYVRVELIENGDYEVFEIHLVVEDCNTENCTEEEVDSFVVECHWNVVNFNGSNDLISYDMDFDSQGNLHITGENVDVVAAWSTTSSANGVMIEFSNVNGPNIQAINGNWYVLECREDRLKLQLGNDIMVLERTCN